MLSDEEKKALDNMKSLLLYSKEHEYFSPFQEQEIDDMNIVLNLIKKQSKEIEELKEIYQTGYVNGCVSKVYEINKKWKDKIKAKIEEYDDKGMTVNLVNRSVGKTFQQAVHYEVKKVLQSLLEKE